MQTGNFTGVILAGGASRRMGTDKAELLINGRSMLDIMRAKLRDAGASNVLLLGRPAEKDGIPDLHPGSGPATAISNYLATQHKGSKHLFVPIDMPAMSPTVLAKLAAQPRWSYFDGFYLPCLGIADGLKPLHAKRIQDLLMIKLAKRLDPPKGHKEAFVNLNNKQDFDQFAVSRSDQQCPWRKLNV